MADQIQGPKIELEDRGSKGRYFLRSPAGDEAEMTFSRVSDQLIIIDHTEVDRKYLDAAAIPCQSRITRMPGPPSAVW